MDIPKKESVLDFAKAIYSAQANGSSPELLFGKDDENIFTQSFTETVEKLSSEDFTKKTDGIGRYAAAFSSAREIYSITDPNDPLKKPAYSGLSLDRLVKSIANGDAALETKLREDLLSLKPSSIIDANGNEGEKVFRVEEMNALADKIAQSMGDDVATVKAGLLVNFAKDLNKSSASIYASHFAHEWSKNNNASSESAKNIEAVVMAASYLTAKKLEAEKKPAIVECKDDFRTVNNVVTGDTVIGRKASGEFVSDIQNRLNPLGYTVKADAHYGDDTRAAVRKLQESFRLTSDDTFRLGVDGNVGKRTLAAIEIQEARLAIDSFDKNKPGCDLGSASYASMQFRQAVDACDKSDDPQLKAEIAKLQETAKLKGLDFKI